MDVAKLEGQLKKLDENLSTLVERGYVAELLTIIHRPGFTTPQEAQLIHALVQSLQLQFTTLERTHDLLLEAAHEIGQK